MKTAAFTLLELAVVLIIISVVTGGVLTAIIVEDERNAIELTNQRLEKIEQAVSSFYLQNQRLPCVAEGDLADSAADFGIEEDCANAAPTGTLSSGAAATEVYTGVVPVKTLGLPTQVAYDGWGSRILYSVVNDLAETSATYAAYVNAANTNGVIQILDDGGTRTDPTDGNQINSAVAKADGNFYTVAYTLVALGKDKRDAFNRVGNLSGGACPSATDEVEESENCDNDAVFRDTRIVDDGITNDSYFYDFVRWKTKEQFEYDAGQAIAAASTLPACADGESIEWDATGLQWVCGNGGSVLASDSGELGSDGATTVTRTFSPVIAQDGVATFTCNASGGYTGGGNVLQGWTVQLTINGTLCAANTNMTTDSNSITYASSATCIVEVPAGTVDLVCVSKRRSNTTVATQVFSGYGYVIHAR